MLDGWVTELNNLEVLSEEMLALARAGEWDEVMSREERRRGLIEALFTQPIPSEAASRLAAAIRAILAGDAVILALGQQELGVLARQLGNFVQGRKAQIAYSASTGGW